MERITSRKNPKIQHLKKLGASREYRYMQMEFLCDGWKLLQEALANGVEVTAVLYCGKPEIEIPNECAVYETERDILEYVSPLKTPQTLLFSCKMPDGGKNSRTNGRRLVLEGIQDPGNVGTMIRTASAMDYESVILLEGCADVYSPKTVRATMGAVFRQCVIEGNIEYINEIKKDGVSIYGAALCEDSVDIRSVEYENFALCIGSEGRGLSRALLEICDKKIIIPMRPDCESLNAAAAAGMIMWESVR